VARGWSVRANYDDLCIPSKAREIGQKKLKWTRLLIIDSQAVKKYVKAVSSPKGSVITNSPMGQKTFSRRYLGLPFTHCTKASVSDDQGLIELIEPQLGLLSS